MVLHPKGAISKALAELRAAGGPDLDIPALANEVEVPVERLCWLDQGQLDVVDLDELERLCRILGRTPNDLLGYEPDE